MYLSGRDLCHRCTCQVGISVTGVLVTGKGPSQVHLLGRDSLSEANLMYFFGRDNLLRYACQVDLSGSDPC